MTQRPCGRPSLADRLLAEITSKYQQLGTMVAWGPHTPRQVALVAEIAALSLRYRLLTEPSALKGAA